MQDKIKKAPIRKAIICMEGPSGVGKTTVCNLLSEKYNTVQEVNELFERSDQASRYWYLEKQVERYKLCEKSDKQSILDGDIFQPIWYNWVYNYPPEFLPKKDTHDFYKKMIKKGELEFPDMYIIFKTEQEELQRRKDNDKTRNRRHFEKHLKFIQPQLRYFEYLKQHSEIHIEFIENKNLSDTIGKVSALLDQVECKNKNDLQLFEKIIAWISK